MAGKEHYKDHTARRMCQYFLEIFEVKAVQCVPPSTDVNGPTSAWVAAAAVAKDLPERMPLVVQRVEGGGYVPKLELKHVNRKGIPWLFAATDEGETETYNFPLSSGESNIFSSDKLVYDEWGPPLITLFQPRGRLTDIFEET